jgi:hypothetical protein
MRKGALMSVISFSVTLLFIAGFSRPTDAQVKVFVSSQVYTGNLGGLAGADAECQRLATSAGLQGTFKAWLSTTDSSPATTFSKSDTHGYAREDGTMIANNWVALTTGVLAAPISITEHGQTILSADVVWTGTSPAGTAHPMGIPNADFCANWTTTSPDYNQAVIIGTPTSTGRQWTDWRPVSCATTAHIYCFQQ